MSECNKNLIVDTKHVRGHFRRAPYCKVVHDMLLKMGINERMNDNVKLANGNSIFKQSSQNRGCVSMKIKGS